MGHLLDKKVVERAEETYGKGVDHLYPNENIVRLIKWFFSKKEQFGYGEGYHGRVLDYGFGPAENMLHLLRCGYKVYGIEISNNAKQLAEGKLSKYPEYNGKWKLDIITEKDKMLPYNDDFFDYILANQVVYFLVDEYKIKHLLNEFKRVLKSKGKFIITMMSRFDIGTIDGYPIGANRYEYDTFETDSYPNRVYIIRDEGHARKLFSMFKVHEIGYFDFYYCGECGHHWVILGEK